MRRRKLSARELERAEAVVRAAWLALPHADRELLQEIGASQWLVTDEPLGETLDRLMRSAGRAGVNWRVREGLDSAIGLWEPSLRIVLVNAGHAKLDGLDIPTWEILLAHIAWHEWGHALSLHRCSPEDVAMGERWLALAPVGVREDIRSAAYSENEYTHELVANVYALLISRRRRGDSGRPQWLDNQIYDLMRRVCGWKG